MIKSGEAIQQEKATKAFDLQSQDFDSLYRDNSIIRYKRARVRSHLTRYLKNESRILELNCGTGEDAIYLASHGHYIHATDISNGMLSKLRGKAELLQLTDRITSENCSYNELRSLYNRGPYDCIFSNFAGLNCTNQLKDVLASFDQLLKPQGTITLVLLPKFCLWEFMLLFRGKWKTAFRRLIAGKSGAPAHIEGTHFRCWYFNPNYVIKHLKKSFTLQSVEGLCTIVPPSYIENFAEKYPRKFNFMEKMENKLKTRWPFRIIGDYYIITLQKK